MSYCWHRERQQQLEELRHNLEKVQEEADVLRSQLRSVQKSAQVLVQDLPIAMLLFHLLLAIHFQLQSLIGLCLRKSSSVLCTYECIFAMAGKLQQLQENGSQDGEYAKCIGGQRAHNKELERCDCIA